MVLFLIAAKAGNRSADSDHPYGHGRIETAATILIGMFIAIIGIGLGYDAGRRLIHHAPHHQPTIWVIMTAVIAIIINFAIYKYLLRLSEKINSPLLLGNANHHKSDIYVSGVVLISVVASFLGLPIIDHVATIIIALMIIKMGGMMIYDCIRELIDTAVDPKTLHQIHSAINQTEGVLSIHQCRTRTYAGKIMIDVHVIVADELTVSEGHYIGDRVEFSLKNNVQNVTDVIVHIDTEDDEHYETAGLPSRSEVVPEIEANINDPELWEQIKMVQLHYRQNKLDVDLYLPLSLIDKKHSARKLRTGFCLLLVRLVILIMLRCFIPNLIYLDFLP